MMHKMKKIFLLLGFAFIGLSVAFIPSTAQSQELPSSIARPQEENPMDNIAPRWGENNQQTSQNQTAQNDPEVPESIRRPQEPLEAVAPEWYQPYSPPQSDEAVMPSSNGLMSDLILQKMYQFMTKTNDALRQVMMIGDGLMCYARYVRYESYLKIEIPDISFLLVGFIIYALGVFMAMSVGMYFVDVSFKFGFAIIFMPISIALWPFPPTKNKFADNLSIIIRNAMLFMMVGIGVAFAVTLINEGLLSDGASGDFWNAIETDNVEALSNSFSLFNSHILVVFFALAYGFKIIEGSVNNYLNAFFQDAAFGSESPMHRMGTQAVGLIAENTVKPAAAYVKDVAKHQTGKAIAGFGKGISKVSTAAGRRQIGNSIKNGYGKVKGGVKSTAHAIANPRETFNRAARATGSGVNKAVHAAGGLVKGTHDILTAITPTVGARESWRQAQVGAVNNAVDRGADWLGGKLENAIAHGSGNIKNAIQQRANKQNAKQLLNDLGANDETLKAAAHEKLESLGFSSKEIQDMANADDKTRQTAVNNIADKMQQQKQLQRNAGNDAPNDSGGTGRNTSGSGETGGGTVAPDETRASRSDAGKKDSDTNTDSKADRNNLLAKESKDALRNYMQNEQPKIDKQLQPMLKEIGDKTKAIENDFMQKSQQADQQKQEEYAAIDNDSTLTATQKQEKKNQADLKNKARLDQLNKERQKAMKSVDKMKRSVTQKKLKHMHNYMKKNTSAEAYERWSKERAENGDGYAQANQNLERAKDKMQSAEQNLKQAQQSQTAAEAALKEAKDFRNNAPKELKEDAKAQLQQAQAELDNAQSKLRLAKLELDQAQDEYRKALGQADISGVRKVLQNAKVIYKQADNAPISLSPTRGVVTAFKTVRHPIKTVKKLKDNIEMIKQSGGKVVLKDSGKIVVRGALMGALAGVRMVKDTGRDIGKVAEGTGSLLGKVLQNFGNSMADNSSHGSGRKSILQQYRDQERALEEEREREAEMQERQQEIDV